MGEEKPEAEDRLGKHIKDGIGDNLSINAGTAGAISDTPDTDTDQH